jgi:uncharacterized protein
MSGSLHTWYSLPDLDLLAEKGATLSGEIELERLTRLKELLQSDTGAVEVSLKFERSGLGGVTTVALEYATTLRLTCQRCLEPMEHHAAATIKLGLLDGAALVPRTPAGYEPVVIEGDRISPAQLVEDELIVELPLVPKHAHREDCGSLVRELEDLEPKNPRVHAASRAR